MGSRSNVVSCDSPSSFCGSFLDSFPVSDVLGRQSEIDISVYDRGNQEAFLGHVRLCLNLTEQNPVLEGWFPLEPRGPQSEEITGDIHLRMHFTKTDKRQFGPNDFQTLDSSGR